MIKHGRVIERGNHQELIDYGGQYFEMVISPSIDCIHLTVVGSSPSIREDNIRMFSGMRANPFCQMDNIVYMVIVNYASRPIK